MRYLQRLLLRCLLLITAMTAVGCHTIDGIGQDLDQAAQTIQDIFD